jgi:hypothetical protein
MNALNRPVPVDWANIPPLDDGRILKLVWMLTSPEVAGSTQTPPVTDMPRVFVVDPACADAVSTPSPTQQNPEGVPVLLQSSRLTVIAAVQLEAPIAVAVRVPANVRHWQSPLELEHDWPEHVPLLLVASLPLPDKVNATIPLPGDAVLVGVDAVLVGVEAVLVGVDAVLVGVDAVAVGEPLVAVGEMRGVMVAVTVAEPVTSGKIPRPQPVLGRIRKVNVPIARMGIKRHSLATRLRKINVQPSVPAGRRRTSISIVSDRGFSPWGNRCWSARQSVPYGMEQKLDGSASDPDPKN